MVYKFFPCKEARGLLPETFVIIHGAGQVLQNYQKTLYTPSFSCVVPLAGDKTLETCKNKGGVPTLNSREKQGPNLGETPVLQSLFTSAMLHLPPAIARSSAQPSPASSPKTSSKDTALFLFLSYASSAPDQWAPAQTTGSCSCFITKCSEATC